MAMVADSIPKLKGFLRTFQLSDACRCLITPNGTRRPWQYTHDTKEYCQTHDVQARTTAELVADLIAQIPLPPGADVVVLVPVMIRCHPPSVGTLRVPLTVTTRLSR